MSGLLLIYLWYTHKEEIEIINRKFNFSDIFINNK